ncbi:unnamed protein product, partial [Sphacelaria rigidula]
REGPAVQSAETMGRTPRGNGISGIFFNCSILLFVVAISLGTAFIFTSMSRNFFKWTIDSCDTTGQLSVGNTTRLVAFDLDMTADIGWREFTITYLDGGAVADGCFDVVEGESYMIGDHQDNGGSAAGFGMVVSWALGLLLALLTVFTMLSAVCGRGRVGFSLTTLSTWTLVFSLGLVVATTVFWWLIEGKFGNRDEALAPRLLTIVDDAASACTSDVGLTTPCFNAPWEMETPGWSLDLGITAMFAYAFAAVLLWMRAPRVDSILAGAGQMEDDQVTKHTQGVDYMPDKTSEDEKARAKDRRSARTGGRAPTSTVGDADGGHDPMTYALEEGGDDDLESQDDADEEEVVYHHHNVHPSVVNHSKPNETQVHDSR